MTPVPAPSSDRGPMLAAMAQDLPAGPGWLYEPKWDGFRCIATTDIPGGGGPAVTPRQRPGAGVPEIADTAARALPPATVVDGEIVRWADGRLDFEALQRRNRTNARGALSLARTQPCHLIVFDLLRQDGTDLTGEPLTERRRLLEQLMSGAPATLALGMQTDDLATAREWSTQLAPVGVEGIVAKRADERYRAGVRGWQKIKHYVSTEAIVGRVTGDLAAPDTLVLGRIHRDDQLHIAGHTTQLSPATAREIASRIRPAGAEHPWPAQLPPSWNDRAARDYHRVVPELVVEVRVDVAATYADDRPSHWRHRLRFLRIREDLAVTDVPADLDLSV